MSRSVSFDRAAEYYDSTRGWGPEAQRRGTELLAAELIGRGRSLEVGVGTGQISIPLHQAGVDVVGMDIAWPMVAKLIEKSGGGSPFPIVMGDATSMPFRDGAFGGAFLRWVLHLIPAWRVALEEIVRVVRPDGVFVVMLGANGGRQAEIQARFAEIAGITIAPPGLGWAADEELDDAMAMLGGRPRDLPPITDVERDDLETFMRAIEENRYSWTWKLDDPALLRRVGAEVRAWAEERFGPLDRTGKDRYSCVWRVYDLG